MATSLGIAVTAVRVGLGVFLPEQVLGDPFALELLEDFSPIG